MSDKPRNWKLALYRLWWAEGYTWRDALWLAAFVITLGVGLCLFLVSVAVFRGPPPEAQLVTIDGKVETFRRNEDELEFQFSDRRGSFHYADESAAIAAVATAMTSGSQVRISVLGEDLMQAGTKIRVWSIAVKGGPARTFTQVSTVWRGHVRDTLIGVVPIALVLTILASAPFFATAYFERRWERERRG